MLKLLKDLGRASRLIEEFITFDIESVKIINKIITYIVYMLRSSH